MENLKIALVEMQCTSGNVQNNLKKINFFVNKAKNQCVDIICFPELAVHGYSLDREKMTCESIEGSSACYLKSLAVDNNITLISGFNEKYEGKNYITQIVCFPDGSMDKYRKTHLGVRESKVFSAGDTACTFRTEKAVFAIEICWDLHFPELSAILSLKGAEIIFAPHASPEMAGNRRDIWLKYLPARAYDNSVFIACCNQVKENGAGVTFSGGAIAIDPKGNIIGENFSGEENMLVLDLKNTMINRIRKSERDRMSNSFFLKYRRPELYR